MYSTFPEIPGIGPLPPTWFDVMMFAHRPVPTSLLFLLCLPSSFGDLFYCFLLMKRLNIVHTIKESSSNFSVLEVKLEA